MAKKKKAVHVRAVITSMLVDPNSEASKSKPSRHGGGRRSSSEPVLGASPHAKLLIYVGE